MPESEQELIKRAQAADVEAFAELARRYERRIYSLALHYAQDPQDAEDLSQEAWLRAFRAINSFKGESIKIGAGVLNGEVVPGADIFLPLKTMNRHGLIAGATGTGKTKTLQVISEALSDASVPVVLMDIKGDLSGLAMPGTPSEGITDRQSKIGVEWSASAYPVEFLTISDEPGVRLRAAADGQAAARPRRRKRVHVDLEPAGFVGRVRHPPSVGRDHPLRLVEGRPHVRADGIAVWCSIRGRDQRF